MTSKIKVDNINKVSDDSNIIKKCGTTITLGASGDSIALASGASQSGFGREGSVNWQTGSIKTASSFTPVSGEGYFVDTSSNVVTANLPAGSAGAIVAFSDYARNFATNKLTITPNGSEKIGGVNASADLQVNGQALTLVYVNSTKGWINVQNAEDTETGAVPFMAATGGNAIVTNGDFKTHIFTAPGTFCVSQVSGVCAARNKVDYLVVGGGGGAPNIAAGDGTGGAGGGGMRFFSTAPGTNSPLNNSGASPNTEITVTATAFPITVGGGGTSSGNPGTAGVASTFSTVTSAGGGLGGYISATGGSGGSGGGGGGGDPGSDPGGAGNTPPVSPPQGQNGGTGGGASPNNQSGGGGGAGGVGGNKSGSTSGAGGVGSYIADSFIGPTAPSYGTPGPESSTRYFSGGAGGAGRFTGGAASPAGGGGQGSSGSSGPPQVSTAGTTNTGGGGGGGSDNGGGKNGGSGIVMIRYKFQ